MSRADLSLPCLRVNPALGCSSQVKSFSSLSVCPYGPTTIHGGLSPLYQPPGLEYLVGGCVLTPQGGSPPLRSPFSFAFPFTSRGSNSVAFHSFLLDYVFIFLKALLFRSSVASFQLLFTEGCSSCSFLGFFFFFFFGQ